MSDKHHGPHCAGSCEGAAYNIEIQRLRAENEVLREAIEVYDRMLASCGKEMSGGLMNDKPVLTPAQKAGWKVGDVGRHESGAIVSLYEDLGGYDLLWRAIKNDAVFNSYLSNVERLIPESEVE